MKTNTAVIAIKRVLAKNPTVKTVIIVPTKVLKDQWESAIKYHQLDYDIEVLVINTASKKPFYCNFLIVDELHKASADTFRQLFYNCNPHFILGLTATYERLDGKEKEVVDKFCPVCDTITVDEAVTNNWLSQYKEYKVLLDVNLAEYEKANQSFMAALAFFGWDWNIAMKALTDVRFQQQFAKQNGVELKQVKANAYSFNRSLQFRKSFIANHPKKIEVAKKIIAARKNKKIITFNSSIKQCQAYGFGYVVHSDKKSKENKETLEKFAKESSGVIHSSKMLIEGLDCPGLSVGIIAGFNSSKTNKTQEIGRVIRYEEGKEAEIFTLILRGTVEEKWFAKSEEEKRYIELNESELDKILNYEYIDNKQYRTGSIGSNNIGRY